MKKLILFLVGFFVSFSSLAAPLQENFIIAKVNKKAITNAELVDRYRFVVTVSKIKITDPQDKKLLASQILDKMIDEELIRQEAASLKMEVAPEEMREAIDVLAAQQKKNATQFKLFFTSKGLSFENYLQQVESEILWSKIISELLRSKVKVTEVEVREFFEQHKFNTDVKKFLIAEILIAPSQNSEQLATKLVQELRQGADFKNIVRQFSASLSAENNGEIGWVSQADIDQKIYAAISKLKKDGYSDAIKLADGHHIFKLLDAKTETHIADQDMAAARNAIFSKKLQTVAKGYSMDLRKKAFVEITQGAF
ncbi:MAG: SurA N-terminal domain-containing protein [Rickettsiales bacterium]|nr:SurA N-terminal domain-containing protein [Rickettsiales bacterium]